MLNIIQDKIDIMNIKQEGHKKNDNSSNDTSSFRFNNPQMIRGGLIGVAISALISWNSGRYNRLGSAIRRLKFIRNFIKVNKKPLMPLLTNYYTPNLSTVVNNFICYSGEPGIGKSYHFQNMAYTQSGVRPSIYLAFKASGKDTTFLEDLAEQVQYGEGAQCPGILSQIIKAVRKIDQINKNPYQLWLKVVAAHAAFGLAGYGIFFSEISATYGMLLTGIIGSSYLFYINFMIPFIVQSFRRTVPLIIFDDLNKIQHLGMLPQIVRYLQLLENNMANVILVSSDEETWSKLRRQPGVKDRLRLRQISYDHVYSAERLLQIVSDEKSYSLFMKYISANKLYKKQVVISLIKQLLGRRQVTLRRFISILKLNDEQEYEKLVGVLSSENISTGEIVQKFTDILYDSEMETMVSNLKNIKRELKISEEQFFIQLKLLLSKGKLQSDNLVAPHLKAYNIVRDLRSEYVFNGKFTYTVFNMAVQQYEKDMREFNESKSKKQSVVQKKAHQSEDPAIQGQKTEKNSPESTKN